MNDTPLPFIVFAIIHFGLFEITFFLSKTSINSFKLWPSTTLVDHPNEAHLSSKGSKANVSSVLFML